MAKGTPLPFKSTGTRIHRLLVVCFSLFCCFFVVIATKRIPHTNINGTMCKLLNKLGGDLGGCHIQSRSPPICRIAELTLSMTSARVASHMREICNLPDSRDSLHRSISPATIITKSPITAIVRPPSGSLTKCTKWPQFPVPDDLAWSMQLSVYISAISITGDKRHYKFTWLLDTLSLVVVGEAIIRRWLNLSDTVSPSRQLNNQKKRLRANRIWGPENHHTFIILMCIVHDKTQGTINSEINKCRGVVFS